MIRVEAEPLPDFLPGHARLVVTGAPRPPGRLVYQLRREGYATGYLGRNGWQSSEEMLAPLDVVEVPEAGGWAVVMGPEVSAHMTPAPYLFRLPSLGQETGIFWPEIEEYVPGTVYVPVGSGREDAPSDPARVRFADAATPKPAAAAAAVAPPDAPPDPPPAAATVLQPLQPTPPPAPPPTGQAKPPIWKQPWPWVALVVLAVVGGGTFAFRDALFGERPTRTEEARPGPATPPQPTAPTPPRPGPAWPAGTDGMTPREVVNAAPDAPGILVVAKRRQQEGRYDDAVVLLETAAERQQAEASFLLARLLDPVGFVAGRPFQQPDGFQAARHYRDAARGGHAEAEQPRAALKAHLEQRAAAGEAEARSALAEYWP
jgi:hypothetical protein